MQKNKENYQKKLEAVLKQIETLEAVPTLLLHSCCAPCSTYVIEYLSNYFHITVFYYNPNIDDQEEYTKRAAEQQKLISLMDTKYPVKFVEGKYDVETFTQMSKHLVDEPEGGRRCSACYHLRLSETGRYAKGHGFDYFATTLSISPLKDASRLNDIGHKLEQILGVSYLPSDFKKKNGYKRSTELSKEHGLYRQDYCGCSYSKKERYGL